MTEDDTFAQLVNMQYTEAMCIAIDIIAACPLGSDQKFREAAIDERLAVYGWTYEKLNKRYKTVSGD